MSTTAPASNSGPAIEHCAAWYLNDTQDATSAELLVIEYICQFFDVETASDAASASIIDDDARPTKPVWLLSEQIRPVLQLSPQHPLFDGLTRNADEATSSVPDDVALPEWEYSADHFQEMIQTVRGDEQLQREARSWWEQISQRRATA